jgi:hypothetical protein
MQQDDEINQKSAPRSLEPLYCSVDLVRFRGVREGGAGPDLEAEDVDAFARDRVLG